MSNIYKIIVLLILIIEVNYFSILNVPYINENSTYHFKLITFLISIISFSFIVIVEKNSKLQLKRYYNLPVVLFIISVVMICLFSISLYNQSIFGTFKVSYFYWIVLLYYFLSFFCLIEYKNFKFLINSIIWIGTIYSLILIVQYYFLKLGIGQFLIFRETGLTVNLNNYRIARPADFIAFSAVLLYAKLHSCNNKKLKNVLTFGLIINLIYLIFVSQTRIYILAVLIAIVGTFFMLNKTKSLAKKYLYFLIFVVLLLGSSQFISNFISSFSEGDRIKSTNIRMEEIEFFLNQIFNNYFFGRGFLDPSIPSNLYLINGPYGNYFVSDVGVLGFLALFGLLGVLFLLIIVFKIIRTIKSIMNKRLVSIEKSLLVIFSLYTHSFINLILYR
ncbi:hypothetical protein M1D49_02730 [Bacillus sp. PK3-056]